MTKNDPENLTQRTPLALRKRFYAQVEDLKREVNVGPGDVFGAALLAFSRMQRANVIRWIELYKHLYVRKFKAFTEAMEAGDTEEVDRIVDDLLEQFPVVQPTASERPRRRKGAGA